jgi:hypothetical protein
VTPEQEQCLITALRSIEHRAREAHRRISLGGARTGATALYRIENEASDAARWAKQWQQDARRPHARSAR